MGKLHSGGHVPKSDFYRLKAGVLVMNKTQLAKLKKAKTQKTKNKFISSAEAPATENESTQAPATKAIDGTTTAEATPQREEAMCPCPSHQQVATTIL